MTATPARRSGVLYGGARPAEVNVTVAAPWIEGAFA